MQENQGDTENDNLQVGGYVKETLNEFILT